MCSFDVAAATRLSIAGALRRTSSSLVFRKSSRTFLKVEVLDGVGVRVLRPHLKPFATSFCPNIALVLRIDKPAAWNNTVSLPRSIVELAQRLIATAAVT